MTKEELIDRINDIEWEDFEAKEAKSELPKNIWETVSAFANTSGGWIVLGVKQNGKKLEISGVANAEKLEQDFLGTLRSQKFNEPVDAKSMLYHIDGHKVLAFHIASSPHKPIYYNNPQNTFIRFGSGDQRATNGEITAMFHNQSFGIKSEQILLDSNLSMLNEDTIRDYRNYFKLYSPRPNLIGNDIADFCKRIGIADNEGHLNYGGLMCFGKEEWVRRYVPTFWMDLVEIPGRSVREARTRYTYRIPEQENLWEYFQIMIRRLRLIVDTPFMMNDEGFNVEDRSQFKILREALVNMLSHFDPFSTIHSCIHIYTDRVEFFNAGGYPVPISQLGNHLYSNPRNPIIAKIFRLVNLSETIGYGFDMMNEWKEITGNDVTFESDICTSTVTFWLDSDKASDRATNRESNYVSNYVSNHVSNYVTENTQKILDYCLTPKTRREILTFLGLTFQTKNYKMHIEPLVSHGFLELTIPEIPKSRFQKFKLTDKGKKLLMTLLKKK